MWKASFLIVSVSTVALATPARTQDMFGPVYDQVFAVDRANNLDGKPLGPIEFTDKFFGYYLYQFDPAQNKLMARVRTTNDRSRPPSHDIACGTMNFMSQGRTIVTAYHMHPAKTSKKTYIDYRTSTNLSASDLSSIDQVRLRAGWCRGVPDRLVHFRSP